MRKTVLVGFLGTTLDQGSKSAARWDRWRPTISLFQHEELSIDRMELLYAPKFAELGDRVTEDIESLSPATQVKPHSIPIADPWDFEEMYGTLLDFALKYPWDMENENYLLHISTGTHVGQICMFLLAEARYFPAKLIQTSPPDRSSASAKGTYRIIDLDLSKYDHIASRFQRVRAEDTSFLKSGIKTKNPKFNTLIERIEQVAITSREPVLLLGPTGAGKSHLARRIYELKKARNQITGTFIDVNCATIRGDAAMSTLFGHTKGAFTGAAQARNGLLKSAHQGILFLDEIGELGADEQAMLLRAIEDKSFLPVGSDKEIRSDFQLIAGTNRDLKEQVRMGRFREDLLARINLWSFTLPALRERREDIAPNIDYELDRFSSHSNSRVSFNKGAKDRFLHFALSNEATWAANFRDLSAAVTRMATLAPGGRITQEIVEEEIERLRMAWPHNIDSIGSEELLHSFGLSPETFNEIDRFDRSQLLDVLQVCKNARSLSEAGRELFDRSGKDNAKYNYSDRLRKYLLRFGITWNARNI